MSDTSTEPMWSVFDTNAVDKRRMHETRPGKRWPLSADQPTQMPQVDAMVFLRDPAFQVFDDAGNRVFSLPANEAAGERVVTELQDDECVARYDELLTPALLARVVRRPGGHKVDPTSPRDVLIAFLKTTPVRAELAPGEKARGAGGQEDPDIEYADSAVKKAVGGLKSMDELLAGG